MTAYQILPDRFERLSMGRPSSITSLAQPMAPLNSDESVFALHASTDVPKLHSAPLGFAIKSSNLTFRAGAVTSRSTPKRRVEIGYAPRIHAGHSLSSI